MQRNRADSALFRFLRHDARERQSALRAFLHHAHIPERTVAMRIPLTDELIGDIHHIRTASFCARRLPARLHEHIRAAKPEMQAQHDDKQQPQTHVAFPADGYCRHRHKEQHREDQIPVKVCPLHEHKAEQIDKERRKGIADHPFLPALRTFFFIQRAVYANKHDRAQYEHASDTDIDDSRDREQRHAAAPAQQLEEIGKNRKDRVGDRFPVERAEHERRGRTRSAGKQARIQDLRRAITQQAGSKARSRHAAKAHMPVPEGRAHLRRKQHV